MQDWIMRIAPEDEIPARYQTLASAMGAREAARLCERYGGQKYSVPTFPSVAALALEELPGATRKVCPYRGHRSGEAPLRRLWRAENNHSFR